MPRLEEAVPWVVFIVSSLIGAGILIGGALWFDSLPDGGCPCDSAHCCVLDETCPYHAPCLCVSAELDLTNGTCAPKKGRDKSDKAGAISMIVVGAVTASSLALLLAMLAVALVVGLLALICMGIMKIFSPNKRAGGQAGSDSKATEHPLVPESNV